MANRLETPEKTNRLAIEDEPVINPKALVAFELLNDPNVMVEGFMPETEASIVGEGFAASSNPKADRLRLTENMMIAASTGTDLASASDSHDDIQKAGFLETLKQEWTDPVRVGNKIPITGALFGIYEMVDVMKSVRRLSDPKFDYSKPFVPKPTFGQQVGLLQGFQTPAQKQPIFFTREGDIKIIENYIERVTRDRTFGGKVAAGISILPTWMVEFAMTGGLASLGKESTKKGMVELLGKYSKTKIGNAAMRAAGWTGGAVTRATLGLPTRVTEKAVERQAQAKIGLREQEGWASSFAKAWGDVVIEAASEEAGAAITGAGAAILRRTPFGSKIVNGLQKAWTTATGGSKGEFARQLFAKGGYSNILGEIGEERLGTILRALTGVEDFGAGPEAGVLQRLAAGLKQDIENLGVEAVVLSVPLAGQSIISRFGTEAARPLITEEVKPGEEVEEVAGEVEDLRARIQGVLKEAVDAEIITAEQASEIQEAEPVPEAPPEAPAVAPVAEVPVEGVERPPEAAEAIVERTTEELQKLSFQERDQLLPNEAAKLPSAQFNRWVSTRSGTGNAEGAVEVAEAMKLRGELDAFQVELMEGRLLDGIGETDVDRLMQSLGISRSEAKQQSITNERKNAEINNAIEKIKQLTKVPAVAEVELVPLPGETKDQFRARVREAKGIKPTKLPLPRPTKAEKQVIDAKKFNQQIKEHEAQVKGELGIIDTEDVDPIDQELGRTMTPEWYEANSKRYKKTIFQKGSDVAKSTAKGIDKLMGVTSTRINKIAPEIFRRLRRHEFNVMTRTTEHIKRIEPFIKATKPKKLGKDFNAFEQALKNSEGKIILEFAQKHGFAKELKELRRVLDELYNAGNAVGLEIDYRKNYMPRVVKDTKGFLEFFQKGDDWSIIRTAIENKESQRGRTLTESERAAVVNTLLRGYRTSALTLTAPGAAKARTVQEVTPEISKFYHSSKEALSNYIEVMNEKIAAREFFGRQSKEITKLRAQQSAIRTRLGKLARRQGRQPKAEAAREIRIGFVTTTLPDHISRAKQKFEEITDKLERMGADDLSNTIGQYVLELVVNKEIEPSQEKELRDLLMGRFDPKSAHGLIGEIIPLTYIDVLTQFTNSITQLEELAIAFYRSPIGFVPAATKALLNLSEITLQDIGVTTISQELTDADARKILSTLLSITQFKRFDAFAKQTFINTALKQLQRQSKKEGLTFNDRLKRVFGTKTDQVVRDLKAGDITEDVKLLIASQLMDVQPISKSETPEAYNRAGNLRILYQLKTFMIKQFDFVRTEALQDMRNPKADPTRFMRGFGRLIWLTFSLALFGAGRDSLVDFINGRPFDLKDSVVDTILRRLFFSRFQYTKALREGFGRAFLEGFVPATKTIDAITKDIVKVTKDDKDGLDIWKSVPIVGDRYYWWFGRGREKALKEQKQAKRDKVRRKPLFTGIKE